MYLIVRVSVKKLTQLHLLTLFVFVVKEKYSVYRKLRCQAIYPVCRAGCLSCNENVKSMSV